MDKFRQRVAEESAKLHEAAMQLSSLDDMAQKDEYIKSDGLKLSAKKTRTNESHSTTELPSVVEDLSGRFVDAFSGAARRTPPRTTVHQKQQLIKKQSIPATNEVVVSNPSSRGGESISNSNVNKKKPAQLISSVAALYEDKHINKKNGIDKQSVVKQQTITKQQTTANTNAAISPAKGQHTTHSVLLVNNHAHILHELDGYSDDDSESSVDSDDDKQQSIGNKPQHDNDIEMGTTLGLANQLEHELEEIRQHSITNPNVSRNNNDENNSDKPKDGNRFMTMTSTMESERERLLQSYESTPPPNNNGNRNNKPNVNRKPDLHDDANKALKAGLSWIQNVASPQLQTLSKQVINQVVSPDDKRQSNKQQNHKRGPMIGSRFTSTTIENSEENITMTDSAAFLADDDMAELNRIRMRNSSTLPPQLQSLLQALKKDRRLSFIVLTLIFGLGAYFFSRHNVDDVLR